MKSSHKYIWQWTKMEMCCFQAKSKQT
jgi:hypothetical protein